MVSWVTKDDDGDRPPYPSVPQWHSVLLQCTRQLTVHVPKQFSPSPCQFQEYIVTSYSDTFGLHYIVLASNKCGFGVVGMDDTCKHGASLWL